MTAHIPIQFARERRRTSPTTVITVAGFFLLLLAHTAALFYWGGQIRQLLTDHDARITRIENRMDGTR